MNDLDALLAGIVADPSNAVRWLVMADWLEENGQPERAELFSPKGCLLQPRPPAWEPMGKCLRP